ncbi:MAG: PLDc N-terminal domain-containing protein [Bacteroidia bacterium]|nr:PLDc N-terminal domain-containing protein [Bacteroidia bacterium]MBT8278464.1 PLDc N-terminal domain-containing protein [Bacteroidia bacterium]NND24607.1 hypothetical protein [Flavobacteriaceae bacterium]NNK61283.1 hypothetical protein [Flavobacteriaceae bacterium]NNL31851.1 hypothetical protein [Flavobacteriaceae bacterium]
MTFIAIMGLWQLLVLIASILIPILALIDILKSNKSNDYKLLWCVIVILLSLLGVLLYLAIGRGQGSNT